MIQDPATADRAPTRRGLSQTVQVVLILAAVAAGIFDHATRGWGAPIAAATFALVFLASYWRHCWSRASFWAGIALVAAAQVPFVIFARPRIEQNRPYMLLFLIVDGLFAALVITLIAQLDSNSPLNSRNYSNQRK